MRHSRHGVVEEVAIMIRTGASEKTVDDYIEKLWKNGEITSRVYDLLVTMNICRYRRTELNRIRSPQVLGNRNLLYFF